MILLKLKCLSSISHLFEKYGCCYLSGSFCGEKKTQKTTIFQIFKIPKDMSVCYTTARSAISSSEFHFCSFWISNFSKLMLKYMAIVWKMLILRFTFCSRFTSSTDRSARARFCHRSKWWNQWVELDNIVRIIPDYIEKIQLRHRCILQIKSIFLNFQI